MADSTRTFLPGCQSPKRWTRASTAYLHLRAVVPAADKDDIAFRVQIELLDIHAGYRAFTLIACHVCHSPLPLALKPKTVWTSVLLTE